MHRLRPSEYVYVFTFPEGATLEFAVDTSVQAPPAVADPPEWTYLRHHQCRCCPLLDDGSTRCPPALALVDIIAAFAHVSSTEKVHTEVHSSRRTVSQDVDAQTALRSLMGLVMPVSGCPILGELRPLARHHLPFADRDETLFRVVGAYLLQQYLRSRDGRRPDWNLDAARLLYRDLQEVNVAFAARIRSAAHSDASSNALVALFSLASLVSMSMDEDLKRLSLDKGEPP